MSTGDTLTAKEAAAALGIAVQKVYKHQKVLKASRAPDGSMVFDARTVSDIVEGRLDVGIGVRGHVTLAQLSSKTAVLVFRALKEERPLADIVIELGVLPEVVERLARAFQRMRGAIVLDGEELKRLYQHPAYMGIAPCDSSEQLLDGLLETFGGPNPEMCVQCGQHPRVLCRACKARPKPNGARR